MYRYESYDNDILTINAAQIDSMLHLIHRAIGDMDSTGSISAVEAALDRLAKQRSDLEELWAARKLRLDLSLRLRIFERDALEVVLKEQIIRRVFKQAV